MNAPVRLSPPVDVRDQFPAIPAGWHYLDTAATAQKPQAVIDAITNGYARDYATVHRGVYQRSSNMTLAYEAARAATATFVGAASPDEMVFTKGATEAINLVAYALPREGRDRVLLSRGATANSKPELEIYADDVKCAHGATVGELDREQLFYAAARGLDPATARALLLEGFVGGLWDGLDDDAIRTAASAALRAIA